MGDLLNEDDNKSSVEVIESEPIETNDASVTGDTTFLDYRELSVQFPQNPQTIGELLRVENYYKALARSFVFIQNRKDSADELMEMMTSIVSDICKISNFQTHRIQLLPF